MLAIVETMCDRYKEGFCWAKLLPFLSSPTNNAAGAAESWSIALYFINSDLVLPFQCTNSSVQLLVLTTSNGAAAFQSLTTSPDTNQIGWLNGAASGSPLLGIRIILIRFHRTVISWEHRIRRRGRLSLLMMPRNRTIRCSLTVPGSPASRDSEFEGLFSFTIAL
jgi:hypothetical protein